MRALEGWVGKVVLSAVLLVCALAPLAHGSSADPETSVQAPEWPTVWEGRTLRPLALSAVLRQVRQPTRMLHPAADCYRGLGYRILQAQLERDAQQRLWRCFIAERNGQRQRVCERIVDATGLAFTDASSWFWAAQLGQSTGPWQAVTTARAL